MHLAEGRGIIMGSGQVRQQPRMDMGLCPTVGRSAINATGETEANALALAKHNERGEEVK